jgi:hypothetical protein
VRILASAALALLVPSFAVAQQSSSKARQEQRDWEIKRQQQTNQRRLDNNKMVDRNIQQQRYEATRPGGSQQRASTTPQRSYTPPPQRSYTPPPQRSYTPPPQRSYTPPPQRSYTPPPQRSYTPPPQRSYTPPPPPPQRSSSYSRR